MIQKSSLRENRRLVPEALTVDTPRPFRELFPVFPRGPKEQVQGHAADLPGQKRGSALFLERRWAVNQVDARMS
jgi:hypothetical protein